MDNRGFVVRVPVRDKTFSPLQNFQKTISVAHPASQSMGTVNLCSGVKRLELEPNHSPQPRAAVKNEWSYPPFTFVAWTVTALFSLTNPSMTSALEKL